MKRWLTLLAVVICALAALSLSSGDDRCTVEWQARTLPEAGGKGKETVYFEVPCEDRRFLLAGLLYLDGDEDGED